MPKTAVAEILDPEDSPIVAIKYHKSGKRWTPHSVLSEGSTFDFDYCRRDDDVYYHCSGSGGTRVYCHPFTNPGIHARMWVSPKYELVDSKSNPITRKQALSLGYRVFTATPENPFDSASEAEGGTDYCIVCDDRMPGDNMCKHVHYEDGCGNTLGCGSPEVDFEQARKSLFRFLRILKPETVDALGRNLASGKYSCSRMDSLLGGNLTVTFHPSYTYLSMQPMGDEVRYEERYWPGVAWLFSLDAKHPTTMLTAGWIWQFQRERWNNQCVMSKRCLYVDASNEDFEKFYSLDAEDSHRFLYDMRLSYVPPKKARSLNDHAFMQEPDQTEECYLTNGDRCVRFSVAEVKRSESGAGYQITFGRMLSRDREDFYLD